MKQLRKKKHEKRVPGESIDTMWCPSLNQIREYLTATCGSTSEALRFELERTGTVSVSASL